MKPSNLSEDLRAYWNTPANAPQLPVWRQILEMTALFFMRRIGPGYYLQARWGRAEILFRHKWQHVNRSEFRRLVNHLNPLVYRKASQHKLIEKAVLTLQGIPTSKFIGFVHALRGKCAQGHSLRNVEELTKLLMPYVHQRVCFKPVESYGGFGFASYQVVPLNETIQLLQIKDTLPVSIADWWKGNKENQDGFLLESFLEQHADLAALNASSVNTVRMWVMWSDGRWRTIGGYLRVGREGSQVDNNSSGGIACPVDVITGKVREAFNPARPGEKLAFHPDSKCALAGFQIPFWEEAKILAGEALAAFPHMRLTGLDMAISTTGPSLIELNMLPDYIGCAWMDLALKGQVHDQD